MTKTTVYNLVVGMTVAVGSFTYGFGEKALFRCLTNNTVGDC